MFRKITSDLIQEYLHTLRIRKHTYLQCFWLIGVHLSIKAQNQFKSWLMGYIFIAAFYGCLIVFIIVFNKVLKPKRLLIWLDTALGSESCSRASKNIFQMHIWMWRNENTKLQMQPFVTNSFVFFFPGHLTCFFYVRPEKIAFCSGALLEFLHVDDYTGRPLSEKDEKWSC